MSLVAGRYPDRYRSEIVGPLMGLIQRGDSACVAGIKGTGKSNLLHFLLQQGVKEAYLPDAIAHRTHLISFSHLPGTKPADSIFEAMTQRVWQLAKDIKPAGEDKPPAGIAPLEVLRSVLEMACTGMNQRAVFVFDEFESLIQHQGPGFLDDLRTLRDDHRTSGNVVFVVFTHRLPQLVRGRQRLRGSKFFEMIQNQIYPLPPYREADAQSMLDVLLEKEGGALKVASQVRKRLIVVSGGHASLLLKLFEVLKPAFSAAAFKPLDLLKNDQIRGLCADIWVRLHTEEQEALVAVIRGQGISPEMDSFLKRRGLLLSSPPGAVFSPLLREYIAQYQR